MPLGCRDGEEQGYFSQSCGDETPRPWAMVPPGLSCRRGSWVGGRFAPQPGMQEKVYTEDSEDTEITEERKESDEL